MDSLVLLTFYVANISFVVGGYMYVKNFCVAEEAQQQKYRQMTQLEINLLNKKIEVIISKDGDR
jgi:D-ribose pyranose/furanose isomerase RbsD